MSHNNNFPILLQRHPFTFAGTFAYRSCYYAVAIETRVQAAVGVIADERKLVDTAHLGRSRDHNLSIALRRHAVAEGATTLGSENGVAEGDETCACTEAEEPRGTFHFTDRDAREKN
jgi:hypothetical protein